MLEAQAGINQVARIKHAARQVAQECGGVGVLILATHLLQQEGSLLCLGAILTLHLLCSGLCHDFQNCLHLRKNFVVYTPVSVESMGGHLFAFDTANLRQPLHAAMVCPAINRCEKEDYELE